MKKLLLLATISFLVASQSATASSFNPPMIGDRIVHSCVMGSQWFNKSNRCSRLAQKFIADEFCSLKGYRQSTYFIPEQRDSVRSKVKALNMDGQHYWSDAYYFAIFQRIDCG